jgi:beta-N-acetylhexosaminidase
MIRELYDLGKDVIWIALNIPYCLKVNPDAATYLCTYSERLPQLKAVCNLITGDIEPRGRLPVSIPDLHESGAGMSEF